MNYITPNNKYEIFVKDIAIKQKFDKQITKSVTVTKHQVEECIKFAEESVNSSDYYKKLVPKDIKDDQLKKEVGKQRLFIEKIAECGVINYLIYKGIDYKLLSSNNIGIKTAIAKEIHTRLIIDKSEFSNNHKDYYIGVHLNMEMVNKRDNINRHLVKDLYNIEEVQIFGYLESKFIKDLRYETIINKNGKKEFRFYTKKSDGYDKKKEYAKLIDTQCKWYYLDKCMPIDNLLKK
ncbi:MULTISPECIES: hypothetical protein [unclassified Romboutsia]|uniref:hypothetical protein n=1 Tax=unclassified Romboutsia TaxID=2626894 RepID=UPI000822FE87|nr:MULTISPECIES: hypothetical protein [unclassified Romboutsia]SCH64392.1 Uncharacterised protein [uncultured Clostridium sp.]